MRTMILALTLALLAGSAIAEDTKEFDGACAYGLAKYGAVVETDCTITWTNPDTHKTYCFSSQNSKWSFLEDSAGNLQRAEKKASEMHMMHEMDMMDDMHKK